MQEEKIYRVRGIEVVAGMQGVGKTHTTKLFIKEYVKNDTKIGRQARPVLIFDVENEYPEAKAIDFNIDEENEFKRAVNIRKIKRPNLYRILPFKKNGIPMSLDEKVSTCSTTFRYFKDGLLVLDDFNQYTSFSMKHDLMGNLFGLRHAGLDVLVHYQSLSRVPKVIWQNLLTIRMHKQTDSVDDCKERVINYELVKLAELVVEKKCIEAQKAKSKIYPYCCWINLRNNMLYNVTKEDFIWACNEYLSINNRIIKQQQDVENADGSKRFNSRQQVIDDWIQSKMYYLER